MFDILIQNGLVLDGSGTEGYYADIAIEGGKIVQIGQNLTNAHKYLDATSLVISPGWIDSHSHSDNSLPGYPDQKEKVEQGITLSVAGHCGSSRAPVRNPEDPNQLVTMADYIQTVSIPLGSGIALLVGHNTLRSAVMGTENRAPTPQEMAQMERLLQQSLDAGAIGMSLGLFYVPGSYAGIDELIALARITAKAGKIITAHIRNEGDQLIEAVEEVIRIARESGCRMVISHHKAAEQHNWGKTQTTLAMIDRANAEGASIYMDVYPYCASATSLIARFVPKQFHPPGTTHVVRLLEDASICEQIKAWGHQRWGNDLSWTLVHSCPGFPQYEGRNLNQIADQMGQPDRMEAVLELLRLCRGNALGYFFMMCETDVRSVLRHRHTMIGTDASVARHFTLYHPRLRGTFPRVLGRFVREDRVVSLPEMIRRMTALPAYVYRLTGKGRIAEGMDADLCIFDPDRILDRADYQNCSAPNEGLQYVLIDGKVVVENGVYNHTRAAKVYIP